MATEIPQHSEASAAHVMAIHAAVGTGMPQDWARALDQLARAAELGLLLAQAELAALSGNWALAHDILEGKLVAETSWLGLRQAIDLSAWLKPATPVPIFERPRMASLKGLASSEVCDWLIRRARPGLKPASLNYWKEGERRLTNKRTNTIRDFDGRDIDFVLALLRLRIAGATRTMVGDMESTNILHYTPGQEIQGHYDTPIDTKFPGFRPRALTVLLALNDGFEGGETHFPAIDFGWKGRRGNALVFWNLTPDERLDRGTFHAGRPVTSGEKWLMNQWVSAPLTG